MAKKWIQDAIKRPGAFTRKAEKNDMTTKQFTSEVLSNPGDYNERTVRQANLAKTLSKMHKSKRK